ncbi:MAG TPA: hypothetical protein VMS16_00950, partial [Mycobacterium sp.]|nr:hypothetical protein [Mycobacterium sp.]
MISTEVQPRPWGNVLDVIPHQLTDGWQRQHAVDYRPQVVETGHSQTAGSAGSGIVLGHNT